MEPLRDYFLMQLESNFKVVPVEVYEILSALFCIVTIVALLVGRRKGRRAISVVALIEVVISILCATVFFRESKENVSYNFIPFWSYMVESRDVQNSIYIENLMNVFMFIPLGFTIGCAIKGIGWKQIIIVSICLSSLIETMQLVLNKGFAELDDVMHNTLGCMVGFGIYSLIRLVYERSSKNRVAVLKTRKLE